jgi:methionyl-tRNA formyltransferase
MHTPARILFAGSPEFAVPSLQALLNSQHATVAVLTQPDRPAGRGRKTVIGPVKAAALAADVPVLQPTTLRDSEVQRSLQELQPDLLVVVAYGQLLPVEVLQIPRAGCVNVHASLLPRWRGAAPIQAAVLAGDTETGVCLMQMEAGLDTGPVYCCERTQIGSDETAGQLQERLAVMGGELLARQLDALLAGQLQALPQSAGGATYAGRIQKIDGNIDWALSADEIQRRIRAYNPWPVAQTLLDGEALRCWGVTRVPDHTFIAGESGTEGTSKVINASPGTILAADHRGIAVQTGDGILLLTEVQAAGRRRISGSEFANSRALVSTVLGR